MTARRRQGARPLKAALKHPDKFLGMLQITPHPTHHLPTRRAQPCLSLLLSHDRRHCILARRKQFSVLDPAVKLAQHPGARGEIGARQEFAVLVENRCLLQIELDPVLDHQISTPRLGIAFGPIARVRFHPAQDASVAQRFIQRIEVRTKPQRRVGRRQ